MKTLAYSLIPLFLRGWAPAMAQAEPSCNLALASNYKFRGQDQDVLGRNGFAKTRSLRLAVQGGCDYAFSDTGFYVGNWNSNVRFIPGNSIEVDLYGGYKFKSGPLDFDTAC